MCLRYVIVEVVNKNTQKSDSPPGLQKNRLSKKLKKSCSQCIGEQKATSKYFFKANRRLNFFLNGHSTIYIVLIIIYVLHVFKKYLIFIRYIIHIIPVLIY